MTYEQLLERYEAAKRVISDLYDDAAGEYNYHNYTGWTDERLEERISREVQRERDKLVGSRSTETEQ